MVASTEMTFEEAKAEVMALIGPDAILVHALRKRGMNVYEWEDGAKLVIKFLITGVVIDWAYVDGVVRACGENVGLIMRSYGHSWLNGQWECHAEFTRKGYSG